MRPNGQWDYQKDDGYCSSWFHGYHYKLVSANIFFILFYIFLLFHMLRTPNLSLPDPSRTNQWRRLPLLPTATIIAGIFINSGCSTTTGAMTGAAVGAVAWPIGAAIWAGVGERIGASAERNWENETQIRAIFDAIPARELQNQILSWKTGGVIYVNTKWKVHVIPKSRNGDVITLEVRGMGSDNKPSWVQIRVDARWVPIK